MMIVPCRDVIVRSTYFVRGHCETKMPGAMSSILHIDDWR